MFKPPPDPGSRRSTAESRWEPRLYPGVLSSIARVRSDLRRGLSDASAPLGLDADLADSIVLCASEMFANACEHTRSGEHDGRVIRTLTVPGGGRALRLSVIDDGHRDTGGRPCIPHQRTVEEWQDAERGRGLLLISHLATRWGTCRVVDFPFCEGLGTVLWADFALPASVAPGFAPAAAR